MTSYFGVLRTEQPDSQDIPEYRPPDPGRLINSQTHTFATSALQKQHGFEQVEVKLRGLIEWGIWGIAMQGRKTKCKQNVNVFSFQYLSVAATSACSTMSCCRCVGSHFSSNKSFLIPLKSDKSETLWIRTVVQNCPNHLVSSWVFQESTRDCPNSSCFFCGTLTYADHGNEMKRDETRLCLTV